MNAFSAADAQEFLGTLGLFLSFVKGTRCDPICAVGLDSDGTRVWESWSSPREPAHGVQSWFDEMTSAQMTDLFPRFAKQRTQKDWHRALRESIYWYLNANNSFRGIDAGIILSQAAIERLSYEYVVEDKKLLSANGFKDLRSSDKFRLLFSSLELPLGIPHTTTRLTTSSTKEHWVDAPHALTEIRNSVVHRALPSASFQGA